MVLLRDLVLFTLFLAGAARRSIRLGGSHREAQEQTNTRTEALEASGDSREALLPQGLTGRVHGRGPQAVASQPAHGHVPSGPEENELPRELPRQPAISMSTQFTDPFVKAMKKKNPKTGSTTNLKGYTVGSRAPPMAIRSGTTIRDATGRSSYKTDGGLRTEEVGARIDPAVGLAATALLLGVLFNLGAGGQ